MLKLETILLALGAFLAFVALYLVGVSLVLSCKHQNETTVSKGLHITLGKQWRV